MKHECYTVVALERDFDSRQLSGESRKTSNKMEF
jgi:hypothetical protein